MSFHRAKLIVHRIIHSNGSTEIFPSLQNCARIKTSLEKQNSSQHLEAISSAKIYNTTSDNNFNFFHRIDGLMKAIFFSLVCDKRQL